MKHAGLTAGEAAQRLEARGPNRLAQAERVRVGPLLLAQFKNPMVALLGVAGGLSALLGEWIDAGAIGAILLLNALVGFFQEFRAERALEALRGLTAPHARVLRDGKALDVPAEEVVVGDLLLLEAGDLVAADARLLEAHELRVTEAALTGESLPVLKDPTPTSESAPLAERSDQVFMGTEVARGGGLAEVQATGMGTEMGRIAQLLAETATHRTPLQKRLARVGRSLALIAAAIVVLVVGLGLWQGQSWEQVLLVGVALGVAAVPEGLPAVVTIALARGVQRMAEHHALVRRLPAVETLGAATVICTDKTGTLTTGRMELRELHAADAELALRVMAACNEASLPELGSPTELALLRYAAGRGVERAVIEGQSPRAHVVPFDSRSRSMRVELEDGRAYVKGAPEAIAELTGVELGHPEQLAARGLRVLGLAEGPRDGELAFVGWVGLADPPRDSARQAVSKARRAGITTVMITGDHPVTARAIGAELGIDEVHARATPEHKIELVRAWRERGAIVAMTGDGVNDAPALREADVGIAMGRTGTEVTRQASDMVLTDDDFATVVEAIRQGRGIFDNIRKTLVYLLGGNAGELALMLVSAAMGLPLPLLPLQLLWINLVTDGLPALALVTDPPDLDVLERPPRPPDQAFLGRREWGRIAAIGLVDAAVTLGVFVWALPQGEDIARTLAFSTLVFCELFRAFAARSESRVLFEIGAFTNLRLLAVIAASVLIQLGLVAWAPSRELLGLVPIDAAELGTCVLLGLVPVTLFELSKWGRRWLSSGS